MNRQEKEELKVLIKNFYESMKDLNHFWIDADDETSMILGSARPKNVQGYPFNESFDDLTVKVGKWVHNCDYEMSRPTFEEWYEMRVEMTKAQFLSLHNPHGELNCITVIVFPEGFITRDYDGYAFSNGVEKFKHKDLITVAEKLFKSY